MRAKSIAATVIAIALIAWATDADAAFRKKLKRSDVPKAVLQTLQKAYPKARMAAYHSDIEEGQQVYEVTLRAGKEVVDVVVTSDARIVLEERLISFADLPQCVRETFAASKYAKTRPHKVEQVIHASNREEIVFQMHLLQPGKVVELFYNADGTLNREAVQDVPEGTKPEDT